MEEPRLDLGQLAAQLPGVLPNRKPLPAPAVDPICDQAGGRQVGQGETGLHQDSEQWSLSHDDQALQQAAHITTDAPAGVSGLQRPGVDEKALV